MLFLGMAALFVSTPAAASADPVDRCTVNDKNIGELSGLAADDKYVYAQNDGGTKLQVFVLDKKTCKVVKTVTNKTDPYDVEDMALAPDGKFWLEDAGDNKKDRENVAIHVLTQDGKATLYRLTYPDGAHDTEALLLDRKGVPYLVTKTPLGSAQVFRPEGPLVSPGPTKLVQVGTVDLEPTDTPGGPTKVPHAIDAILVTGGAVSADGTVVALRTYTDAYLWSAPDGDVAAALKGKPTRVPLPDQPQGEAIAFEPDGTLISGSEGVGQPIRAVAQATSMVRANPDGGGNPVGDKGTRGSGATASTAGFPWGAVIGVGIAVVLGVTVLYVLLRRRGRA
jgi:hypothetical protein